MVEAAQKSYKIVMLGDAGVGKTCIVNRYIKGQFSETEATLGSNRRFQNEYTKEIMWDNVNKDFSGEKVAMNNNHILSYTMISMLFQCCDQCGLGFANTGLVSYSARQCWCGEFNGRHDIKLKV